MDFQIPCWKEGMSDEDSKNVAYAERNLLALLCAQLSNQIIEYGNPFLENTYPKARPLSGWYVDTDNNWDGWHRVISIEGGKYTFHIPDDFPVGNLPEIQPNWDGHSTQEKWIRVLRGVGVDVHE